MILIDKQIEDYQNDGVIIIKDVFKEWIEPLRKGFQKVLNSPSKHGRENVTDDSGRFFEDYCNCLLYTSPSPRDGLLSRMPSSA